VCWVSVGIYVLEDEWLRQNCKCLLNWTKCLVVSSEKYLNGLEHIVEW